ncbi:MAG: 1-acyl-sn-glycerol-3-phosphate acyltransferase, partial [Acidimicrobiia bacterium]|nr:1-acyl-sn-glycerol-3-phosphate acyltransferase [Acidimicrobiia bacterium]
LNDSAEIVLAPVYWRRPQFGHRLQCWSVETLARRAEQLLGLRLVISDDDLAALTPGPVIVISRHVSLFDASLPGLLYQRQGYSVRGVIMAELLADPGFDLLYPRLGSVFIPRDDGPRARAAIAAMSDGADNRTALVLFPEGRLFRPSVRDRALARLAQSDPDRSARLGRLRHVLPPRSRGFLTLLASNPDADVVLIDQRGLDRYRRLADIAADAPMTEPVTVTVKRFHRPELPTEPLDQAAWLDGRWLELDQSLDDRGQLETDPARTH